jgi:hypothetical protein
VVWTGLIILGAAAVLFLILPLIICIGLLFDTVRIPTYDPEPADRIPSDPALDAALAAGFTLLGHCTDGDKGWKRGLLSFLLSPDGLVLVRLLHNKLVRRAEIMTRYPGKYWLVTMDKSGINDLSGLDLIDALMDAPFQTLLQHHHSRVAAMNRPAMPFLPASAIADARQHFRDRVDLMAGAGLARYTSPNRATWRHTPKGAVRHMVRFYGEIANAVSDSNRSRARRQELEWGVRQEQFLVGDLPPPPPAQPVQDLPDKPG